MKYFSLDKILAFVVGANILKNSSKVWIGDRFLYLLYYAMRRCALFLLFLLGGVSLWIGYMLYAHHAVHLRTGFFMFFIVLFFVDLVGLVMSHCWDSVTKNLVDDYVKGI